MKIATKHEWKGENDCHGGKGRREGRGKTRRRREEAGETREERGREGGDGDVNVRLQEAGGSIVD